MEARAPQVTGPGSRARRTRPSLFFTAGRYTAHTPPRPLLGRLWAVVAQRCPACLTGPLFVSRWRLREKCPACGYHYPTAPSRALPRVCAVLTAAISLLVFRGIMNWLAEQLPPQAGLEPRLLASLAVVQLVTPSIYRYLRTLWEHLRVLFVR